MDSNLTKKIKKNPDEYLARLEQTGLRPTFWSSRAYLDCLDLIQIEYNGSIWLEEDGLCLFPPINSDGLYDVSIFPIWAIPSGGWDQYLPEKTFLDWEYLYWAPDFQDLSGGKWSIFRKNSRKWPRSNTGWSYSPIGDFNKIQGLLLTWLENRDTKEEIQDSEILLKYLKESKGEIYGLFHNDKLLGLNCWDNSYAWINFRYSFVDPNEAFLSEFIRLLFYQSQNGWVNDGGALGNQKLERFKDKLNPRYKNEIYTTREVKGDP